MKIHRGQPVSSRTTASDGASRSDGRFQVLLDGELAVAAKEPRRNRADGSETQARHRRILGEAADLLDSAIAEIEAGDTPRKQTVESLQKLRRELVGPDGDNADLRDAEALLATEAERLKSW